MSVEMDCTLCLLQTTSPVLINPNLSHTHSTPSCHIVCPSAMNTMPTDVEKPAVAPFGTWKSPLAGDRVYEKSSTIMDLLVDKTTGRLSYVEVGDIAKSLVLSLDWFKANNQIYLCA